MVCTLPASSPSVAGRVTPPGTSAQRQVARARERHHHGGQPLVARRDAQHGLPRRQRADEAPQHDGRVVAVRQAVEHAGRALRAAVARIRCRSPRTARSPAGAQRVRRLLDEEADLPVPRVIAERDGRAVGRAHAARGREHQHLRPPELARGQAHAHVLSPAEEVTAGPADQVVRRHRETPRRSGRARAHLVDRRVGGGERIEGHTSSRVRRSSTRRESPRALRSASSGGSTAGSASW